MGHRNRPPASLSRTMVSGSEQLPPVHLSARRRPCLPQCLASLFPTPRPRVLHRATAATGIETSPPNLPRSGDAHDQSRGKSNKKNITMMIGKIKFNPLDWVENQETKQSFPAIPAIPATWGKMLQGEL